MHARGIFAALVAAVAAVVLVGAAGAGTAAKPTAIHITSVQGAKAYLHSIGMNPKSFVIQRGKHNFAGARAACPGARWHCTAARHVIQFASGGGSNSYECTPSIVPDTFSESEGGPDCVIVQVGTGGTNTARCIEHNSDAVLEQSCDITQSNTTGTNSALVDQALTQSGNATSASQSSTVQQSNVSGDNVATTNQSIDQRAQSTGSGGPTADTNGQTQQSDQSSDVEQTNGTGHNSSNRNQTVSQFEQSKGGVQSQNNDIFGTVNQSGTGGSTNSNVQDEHQNEVGGDSQTQIGPLTCCSVQGGGGSSDSFDIKQHANQHATSAAAFQNDDLLARCFTDGLCHVNQHANENGATGNFEQTAPAVVSEIFCTSGGGDAPTASSSGTGFCTVFQPETD